MTFTAACSPMLRHLEMPLQYMRERADEAEKLNKFLASTASPITDRPKEQGNA